MELKKNIGKLDRIIRLVIAIALLIYAYIQWSWIALALGIFTLFESFMSWCIFYQIIGKSTCPLNRNKK